MISSLSSSSSSSDKLCSSDEFTCSAVKSNSKSVRQASIMSDRKDDSGNESLGSVEDGEDVVNMKIPALDKYNLRVKSIQKRIEVEKKRKNPRKEPKPKSRPPPLSKYRRKNANARERSRMQEINQAFIELKKAVPHLASDFESGQDQNSKLTKITTLRLAVNYIAALTMILAQTEPPSDSSSSSSSSTEDSATPMLTESSEVQLATSSVASPSSSISSSSSPSPCSSSSLPSPVSGTESCSSLISSSSSSTCQQNFAQNHQPATNFASSTVSSGDQLMIDVARQLLESNDLLLTSDNSDLSPLIPMERDIDALTVPSTLPLLDADCYSCLSNLPVSDDNADLTGNLDDFKLIDSDMLPVGDFEHFKVDSEIFSNSLVTSW